jgi:hypothetical protein
VTELHSRQDMIDSHAAAVRAYASSPEFRATHIGLIAERVVTFIKSQAKGDAPKVVAVLAAALDDMGAGMPELSALSSSLRADADWWADFATPLEIEAVTAAGLRKIEHGAFGLAARKRILAMMWASLTDDDRRAFLSRVDPKGVFRAKGAA